MKLCLFIALSGCLIFWGIAGGANPNLENLGRGEHCFYSTERLSSVYITKTTDLGYSYIYHCDSINAAKVRQLFTQIDGESITLKNTSAHKVLQKLNYKQVSQSVMGDLTISYAYSPRGEAYIQNGNQKINLQIAVSGSTTVVGWPVILGSY